MHGLLIQSIHKKITLTDAESETVKHFFIPKKIRKRQFLSNAGDVLDSAAFVEKGLMRSFTVDNNGNEHVIQFAPEGWWIADMSSFISGEGAVFNIEALEDSQLLILTKPAMEEMINALPKMEHYFRKLMENHIVALQRRIIGSLSLSAEEKYLKMMEILPDIIARASQQHIASYLGITPETLSRIRKQVTHRK